MIYMDNAATTSISEEVLAAMLPFLKEHYGNPSSIYRLGQKAKEAIENARFSIAHSLCCKANEIYFTGSGTEADNWALNFPLREGEKNHIITTKIEHPAILQTCKHLETHFGTDVTYLDVDRDGLVRPSDIEEAIRENTAVVSCMFANNEIGTIEPIKEVGEICKRHNVLFHVDAVQALGNVEIDLSQLPVDMMSFSAHKIRGPKGVGMLFVRENIHLSPYLFGGAQERNYRAGTENVASIVGFAKAAEIATENLPIHVEKESQLRDAMMEQLLDINGVSINGSRSSRLPGNVNLSIDNIKPQRLIPYLDRKGICVSGGSACSAGSIEPSHVLLAIGESLEHATSPLRITLNYENTMEEVEQVVQAIREGIDKFRK